MTAVASRDVAVADWAWCPSSNWPDDSLGPACCRRGVGANSGALGAAKSLQHRAEPSREANQTEEPEERMMHPKYLQYNTLD